MFLILTLIVLVAAFNIVSGLIMLVKDKGPDIAILRTMGASQGSVMRVFFITGASIGVVGTLGGFLLGTVVCLNIESIRQFISWITNREMFLARALFPLAAARRDGRPRDDGGGRDGADACRWRRRSIRRSARRGSIRSRRFAMSEAAADRGHAARGDRAAAQGGRVPGAQPPFRLRPAAGDAMPFPQDDAPVLFLSAIERHYRQGDGRARNPQRRRACGLAGPVGGAGRAVRRRQIHACCMSPACSNIRTPARSISTRSRPRRCPTAQRTRLRRTEIGFVYQFHHLLPEFSAIENVILPQMIRGLSRKEAASRGDRAAELSRAEGSPDAPAGGIVGRRAAAGRDRARGRQCAAHPAGRRADRQSRSAHRRSACSARSPSWCGRPAWR